MPELKESEGTPIQENMARGSLLQVGKRPRPNPAPVRESHTSTS